MTWNMRAVQGTVDMSNMMICDLLVSARDLYMLQSKNHNNST